MELLLPLANNNLVNATLILLTLIASYNSGIGLLYVTAFAMQSFCLYIIHENIEILTNIINHPWTPELIHHNIHGVTWKLYRMNEFLVIMDLVMPILKEVLPIIMLDPLEFLLERLQELYDRVVDMVSEWETSLNLDPSVLHHYH